VTNRGVDFVDENSAANFDPGENTEQLSTESDTTNSDVDGEL
jgi:hypothetical protein